MKSNVTKKYVNAVYDYKFSVPYCNLQCLLALEDPYYYTSGVYGWNADIYNISFAGVNACIVTGYRPFGNVSIPYQESKDFEEKANAILCSCFDIDIKQDKLRELIKQLVCLHVDK